MATDIREAFEKLKASISSEDARDFHSTTLQDVRSAVLKIEQQQAQRQSLRNMRRIEPFLKFMETYARVIEVCCQGFSPMAWVWVGLTSNDGVAVYTNHGLRSTLRDHSSSCSR